MKYILTGLAIAFSCTSWAYEYTGSLISGGITRSYVVHAPGAAVSPNLPVMLVMHGDGGTGQGIQSYSGFDAIADANNFVAVYPNAISSSWNRYVDNVAGDAGLGNPNAPDDVQFISDLIDHLCSSFYINSQKVYATGHSAGGFMAYNLALTLPNKIAAFAPVAASLWGESSYINQKFATNYTKIPIYHIHGSADNTVDYPDANNIADSWGEWPLSGFGNANCGSDTYSATSTIVSGVEKKTFCGSNTEVYLIRIIGGGHGWPNVAGYNTAQNIWNFCNQYQINTVNNCQNINAIHESINENIILYPNPASTEIYLNLKHMINPQQPVNISILDISGKNIYTLNSNNFFANEPISINMLNSGIYLLEFTNGSTKHLKKLIIQK